MSNLVKSLSVLFITLLLVTVYNSCGKFQLDEMNLQSINRDMDPDKNINPDPGTNPGTDPVTGTGTDPNFIFKGGSSSAWHKYTGAANDITLVSKALQESHGTEPTPVKIKYVAPPQGDHKGSGTKSDPYRDFISVIKGAQPGDHIYLQPGEYDMSKIRDTFDHDFSALEIKNNSGEKGKPIVVATDPEEFDAKTNSHAVINFKYNNIFSHSSRGYSTDRSAGVYLWSNYWTFKDMEMKNAQVRMFWIMGNNIILDNLHLHHVSHEIDTFGGYLKKGSLNNEGIVVFATSRDSYNFLMNSKLHHVGMLDSKTGIIDTKGFNINAGCTYSETRQSYDSKILNKTPSDTSFSEVMSNLKSSNGHVYLFNNEVHDCSANGLGTKTSSEGPFFYLSNVIYNLDYIGIKNTKSHSLIRNNIIYSSDASMKTAIQNGYTTSWSRQLINATNSTIENNTIINTKQGVVFNNGWNVNVKNNVILSKYEPLAVIRRTHDAISGASWPNNFIIGTFMFDLDSNNPYYTKMPTYFRGSGFKKLKAENNLYNKEPSFGISSVDSGDSGRYPIKGMKLPENYEKRSFDELKYIFNNPDQSDFRILNNKASDVGGRGSESM